MAGNVLELNAESFSTEVEDSLVPVLVDFWAEWCAPCRRLAPIVEELANEYTGKVKFCKVNVEEEGELAQRFGIRSIPTIIIFKDGKPVNQLIGLQPKAEISKVLDQLI
ncbi:MAG: thioredoxin [Candidatus Neomarinimicrobiota bacterium]|nr:thioredoxin [Candidatus Neomarinimicrobiota bacterium]RKY45373.1 MAG: thioredoxin [Candidatus Neomarinimicrobiota bacterium]